MYDDVNAKNPRVIVLYCIQVLEGFILNGTISTHMLSYKKENYELTKKFMMDLYMDDSTTGVPSVKKG